MVTCEIQCSNVTRQPVGEEKKEKKENREDEQHEKI